MPSEHFVMRVSSGCNFIVVDVIYRAHQTNPFREGELSFLCSLGRHVDVSATTWRSSVLLF